MELKKEWVFVANYNGKKVKKYITTREELDKHEWISETKFRFRDENNTYYEGLILAEEDNEENLQDMVSEKNPRCPHNAFNPFPDMGIKPINTLEKWKKKLATIALNDFSITNKRHEAVENKNSLNNNIMEKAFVEMTNPEEGEESTLLSKHKALKINDCASCEKTELLQERKRMNFTLTLLGKNVENKTNQVNETVTSSDASKEKDELSSNSKNVIPYVKKGEQTLSLTKPAKKIMNRRFVITPKKIGNNKKDVLNKCMISKKKYNRLLQKYKILKTILSEQRDQYTMDLQVQLLAQCLYKAIEKRYYKKDEEDDSS